MVFTGTGIYNKFGVTLQAFDCVFKLLLTAQILSK